MPPHFHILVPTDFSTTSREAFKYALSLASVFNPAKLTLLHVVAGTLPTYDEELGVLEPNRLLARMNMQEEKLSLKPEQHINERVEFGDPAEQIQRVAEETSADLVVMGTHGRTGLDRVFMGSVAESLLRHAEIPVLFVKTKPHKPKYAFPDETTAADKDVSSAPEQ